jgi:hypothetical protein
MSAENAGEGLRGPRVAWIFPRQGKPNLTHNNRGDWL